MTKGRTIQAIVELLVAASLWGFGFIASVWALETLAASELLFLRFVIASLLGLPVVLMVRHSIKHKLRLSFWPAILLMGTLAFQTWGLKFTTPTKSGFITTLYVVFVPILESILGRKRLSLGLWGCVAVALFGTALIVNLGVGEINFGDALTFLSMLVATGQIYWMGSISPNITRAFVFNMYQCFWCMVLFIPFLNVQEFWPKLLASGQWPTLTWVGLISLSAGSTLIAFYLQVRAQKNLSRTVSSLLFLLESPFAMIFAIMLLGDQLKPHEAVGALLIFASALAATWIEANSKPRAASVKVS